MEPSIKRTIGKFCLTFGRTVFLRKFFVRINKLMCAVHRLSEAFSYASTKMSTSRSWWMHSSLVECHQSVVKQLDSVESMKWICWTNLSQWMQMRGMAFIPDNVKSDIDIESDTKTYSQGWNCLGVIFKRGIHWPYMTTYVNWSYV
jgi:hypothetical protein